MGLGQDISLNENVTVNFDTGSVDLTVKAVAADIDFMYMVDPESQMSLFGQLAVVWIDIDVLRGIIAGGMEMYNQLLFTVEDRLNKDMTFDSADALTLKFAEFGMDVSTLQFTIFDESPDRVFYEADNSMDDI